MFCRRSLIICLLLLPFMASAQNTTGSIQGTVKTTTGEILMGATVKLIHEPTGSTYFSKTSKQGIFLVNSITPGGPFTLEVSFIGYNNEKRKDIYISLGDDLKIDIPLSPQTSILSNVTLYATSKTGNAGKTGATVIGKEKINELPAVGRNMYDYLKSVPQAKLVNSFEGAVSFAGQNNRYNVFYVDGAVNNDVFGLSASGTNGGQAGITPLSIDAIDQFQVAVSPYDASVGNFTGGSINAVTRSGSNKTEGSVYHFFSNRRMAGKTSVQKNESTAQQNDFATHTSGWRLQGAFVQNKIFYFLSVEIQRDRFPKPFDINQYQGNTKELSKIKILANTLQSTYHYDAGSFTDATETVNADRLVARLDWNMNNKNKFSISNRYTKGQRANTYAGNSNTIHFSNNGFLLNTITHSVSAEWRTVIANRMGNKLLVTYTTVTDDRSPLGKSFPRVRINDGEGAFIFGSDNSSGINLLTQKNWTVLNKLNFISGKHLLNMGIEMEYNSVHNAFIQNSFGNYTYSSLGDFLTNDHPSVYQLGFPLLDNAISDGTASSARFAVMKVAMFANDEIRPSQNTSFHFGLRADYYRFLTKPVGDEYVNNTAIPVFSKYWNTEGAQSGVAPAIPLSVSPRIGFLYRVPTKGLIIQGGMGLFSGRIPLAWPGGLYTNNGLLIGAYRANAAQLHTIRFRPDPYHQWTDAETGAVINKEPLNLMSEKFQMPSLFRTSVSIEKKFSNGLSVKFEGIFSKNINEISYTNINLLPATGNVSGPDNRLVYPIINNGRIPLNADSSNAYEYVILLGNNKGRKGYSHSFTTTIAKQNTKGWNWDLNYTYGKSMAVNDGTASVNVSQWRLTETVNGRNFPTLAVSDFSMGHRIFARAVKQFYFNNKKRVFSISLTYTGQSGTPFSYVYTDGSITRDDGMFGAYDLIYVPTQTDLDKMIFLPNTINGNTYTGLQQKEALDLYIRNNTYLNSRRGKYAERNGSRTPFTQTFDLRLKQDLKVRLGKYYYQLQLTFDIFNLGNLFNSNWGLQYAVPFNHFGLISFAGYTNQNSFIPQYRFNPNFLQANPWTAYTGTIPAYASRWSGQMGIRFTFN